MTTYHKSKDSKYQATKAKREMYTERRLLTKLVTQVMKNSKKYDGFIYYQFNHHRLKLKALLTSYIESKECKDLSDPTLRLDAEQYLLEEIKN